MKADSRGESRNQRSSLEARTLGKLLGRKGSRVAALEVLVELSQADRV